MCVVVRYLADGFYFVSAGPEGIACWFIDTDYNEESFFVRHAYFLGQNDPYQALMRYTP